MLSSISPRDNIGMGPRSESNVGGRKPEPSPESCLSALTITSHVAPTQAAIDSASHARPNVINLPPRSPSPKPETSSDLSSDSQNHDMASQELVESSSKAALDAMELPPDSLSLTRSPLQEAN
jgi:hypothetical protein